MSKLREKLEEGKEFVPSYEIAVHLSDAIENATRDVHQVAETFRLIRKTTKAYRGKELKKLQDLTNKLIVAINKLDNAVDYDKLVASKKTKSLDFEKLKELQKGLDTKVSRQTGY